MEKGEREKVREDRWARAKPVPRDRRLRSAAAGHPLSHEIRF